MHPILVSKPSQGELAEWKIASWSPWECEPSSFDWEYDAHESAYLYEGKVTVESNGTTTLIKAGDLVHFPRGMKCHWHVMERIRKVYFFDHPRVPFNTITSKEA
jgi:uncharacterized cupin superfamily protein